MIIAMAFALAGMQTSNPAGTVSYSKACAYKPGMPAIVLVPSRTRTITLDGKQTTETVVAVNGVSLPYSEAWRQGRDQPWLAKGQPVKFNKKTYALYGSPRVLASSDLVPIGDKDGVLIAAAKGDQALQVIYVLHSGLECSFQPYRLQG